MLEGYDLRFEICDVESICCANGENTNQIHGKSAKYILYVHVMRKGLSNIRW